MLLGTGGIEMKKVYKKLTEEQKKRGVIFTSTLSTGRTEQTGDNVHEVLTTDSDKYERMKRLVKDSFFNDSPWKFNIIRK